MAYFLDLFAGIGGFSLGAQWAGIQFDGHYYSEIDKYAIKVYEKNFPGAIPLGDIKKINGKELPNGEWIIAGGFPCQDISVAGKGAGLEGARSGLWYEYARLIGELRPRFAIMENVGALAFRGLDSVLGSLAALGYDAEWQDIRASDVGAPHRRERIWIVGYPSGSGCRGLSRGRAGKEPADRHFQLEARAIPDSQRNGIWDEPGRRDGAGRPGEALARDDGAEGALADTSSERCGEARGLRRDESEERATGSREAVADTTPIGRRAGRAGRPDTGSERQPESALQALADTDRESMGRLTEPRRECNQWATEPDVGRVAHGIPARMDRLKCLGNSIVPQIAEMIFAQLDIKATSSADVALPRS